MQACVVNSDGHRIVIQIEVDTAACRDLVDCEEAIQKILNDAGILATAAVLKHFDTDGQPIERDGRRFTSKGQIPKEYQTPFGPAEVARHVYQHSGGGATYCPLDELAGIVLSATPKFARMIASKYAEFGSARVQEDMAENHGRRFSRGYVSKLAEAVAVIAESEGKQAIYRLPEFDAPIETIVVAVDEIDITSFRPGPAKVAIASVGFYDGHGQRQHIVYLSELYQSERDGYPFMSDPGHFISRLERELQRSRERLAAHGAVVGISAGQPWCTEFLQGQAAVQFIDPVKPRDMLAEAAAVYFECGWRPEGLIEDPEDLAGQKRWDKRRWVEDARDRILSSEGLRAVIGDLEGWIHDIRDETGRETISRVMEFLVTERAADRMNYQDPRATHVFETAGILADSAKVIFGDRIGHPKFKIGLSAARAILILRELTRTPGRWDEFWSRVRGKAEPRDRRDPTR
jgi:hypothetical protein